MIRVFISSVQREFAEERQLLCKYLREDALLGKFFVPFIFEELPAINLSAPEAYLTEASTSDIYLGLYGHDYGYEDAEGISPTEREYDVATANNRHRIVFIKRCDERHPKEQSFIHKVEQDVVRKSFADYDELRTAVYAALIRFLEEKEYLRLLPWDASICPYAKLDDIDEDKVDEFVAVARKHRNFVLTIGLPTETVLKHLNLIDDSNRITNAALMLFGKKPQRFSMTSEVKCMQFYGTKVEKPVPSYQIFKGDVFQLVDQATNFVMSRVDTWVGSHNQTNTAAAPSRPELPIDAVHEAICNAVAHRDYTDNGSVQVMLFQDRLEVWNPGILPYGLTIPQLEEPHKSQPRNPLIAEPMFLKGYIEKAGTGTEDIISKCENYGLERPVFRQDSDFKVTIWRKQVIQKTDEVIEKNGEVIEKTDEVIEKNDEVIEKTDEVTQKIPQVTQKRAEVDHKIEQLSQKAVQLSQKLSQKTIEGILFALYNDSYISAALLSKLIGVSTATVNRYLSFLTDNGFISHIGPDKGGYRVINWSKLT